MPTRFDDELEQLYEIYDRHSDLKSAFYSGYKKATGEVSRGYTLERVLKDTVPYIKSASEKTGLRWSEQEQEDAERIVKLAYSIAGKHRPRHLSHTEDW